VLFGLPEFAVYLAVIPMALYLPFFYSRDLGLDIADIGLLLMVARISDVITDPLIGWLSDRTKTRWGRRKPWMVGGAPIMMIAAYQLFAPSVTVTNTYLLVWSVVLWFGWTLINISYFAWGRSFQTTTMNALASRVGARRLDLRATSACCWSLLHPRSCSTMGACRRSR
jgi:Na+/melibiose symporter-like transporter